MAPGAAGTAAVRQNSKEPGLEPLGIAASQRAPGPHERILQRLFGILPTAQHVQRVRAEARPVAPDQRGIGFDIAVEHTPDERAVGLLCH